MSNSSLDMFDEAEAMVATLRLCEITQEELARRLGVSQSYVANKLRLLRLTDEEVALVRKNHLSERHARAVLRLESKEKRLAALEKVVSMSLNVRECEAIVEMLRDEEMPRRIKEVSPSMRIDSFCHTLKESLVTLNSLGISVSDYTEYLGKKMYITLAIDIPV